MSKFVIRGGRPLSGTLKPVGNKNAALPMLAASVLTDAPVTLRNMPHIEDVAVMLDLLKRLGVSIERRGRTVILCAKGLHSTRLNRDLCRRVRGSILLAGPLAARHGQVSLYPPGGDVIGRRRVDTHFYGLRELGISLSGASRFVLKRTRLRGADLLLDEASVTATENILMAASLARGKTTIFNAACEPHVRDLGVLLSKMGARIQGLGTNRIRVEGVPKLNGAIHTLSPDHIEVGSYIAAAAATRGQIQVQGMTDTTSLKVVERGFQKLGMSWSTRGARLSLRQTTPLRIQKDLGSAVPRIEDGIWPAFPSDLMSVAIVLATQASGTILFFEKLFESRMYFVDRLIEMGAQIIQCDPHRVMVTGPSKLHATLQTSPDIRAGMALIIAALCAKGESIIDNAQVIDRGYEHVDERLQALGAHIERVD